MSGWAFDILGWEKLVVGSRGAVQFWVFQDALLLTRRKPFLFYLREQRRWNGSSGSAWCSVVRFWRVAPHNAAVFTQNLRVQMKS